MSAFDIEACVHRSGQEAHDIGKYARVFLRSFIIQKIIHVQSTCAEFVWIFKKKGEAMGYFTASKRHSYI